MITAVELSPDTVSGAAIALFVVAGLCGTYRVIKGPDLADRIIALDVTLISAMGGITVQAARNSDATNLVVLIVIAIIGFTATVAASRFLEPDGGDSVRPGDGAS